MREWRVSRRVKCGRRCCSFLYPPRRIAIPRFSCLVLLTTLVGMDEFVTMIAKSDQVFFGVIA